MGDNRIAIIIPAYNEQLSIGEVLKKIDKRFKIFVIDDGSTDHTSTYAQKNGATVFKNKKNLGYQNSLFKGFDKVLELDTFEAIITMDADGEHKPEYLIKMEDSYNKGAEFILPVRSHYNRVSEHMVSFFSYLNYKIKDPMCGMKLYSTVFLKKYFSSKIPFDLGYGPIKFAKNSKIPILQFDIKVSKRNNKSKFGSNFIGEFKIIKNFLKHIFLS